MAMFKIARFNSRRAALGTPRGSGCDQCVRTGAERYGKEWKKIWISVWKWCMQQMHVHAIPQITIDDGYPLTKSCNRCGKTIISRWFAQKTVGFSWVFRISVGFIQGKFWLVSWAPAPLPGLASSWPTLCASKRGRFTPSRWLMMAAWTEVIFWRDWPRITEKWGDKCKCKCMCVCVCLW